MSAIKTPKYQTKIHLPELPGSFTFKKNGKLRLDQQVKKFCLLNKCGGCFEVKVHFGIHTNPNKIEYDAKENGIAINTLNDQQKYKLFVPYPKGLKLSIPKNPEAQFFCGILSAKLAIIDYEKNHILLKNKKNKKNNNKLNKIDDDQKKIKTKEERMNDKKLKMKQKKQRRNEQRKRKLSLNDLNKRIAKNNDIGIRPKKKRKLNKKKEIIKLNEMNMNDQHKLIDGVVDKIENEEKVKRKKEMDKDKDIKEYLQNRAEKKRNKQQRKKEIRQKFLDRKNAKKKANKMEQKAFKKSNGKKVTFNI